MASNYTEHYDLCQWETTDQVQRTEFNADNAKIDAALDALAGQVAEKADGDDLAALSETVAGHTSALAGCGNCQIYFTSYVGQGRHGEDYAQTLTFPGPPLAVLILASDNGCDVWMVRGASRVNPFAVGSEAMYVTWSGNSITWYAGTTASQMNSQNVTYRVIALIPVDE